MKTLINDWKMVILFTLTLGLAPFFPEPHIWGKLKWIAGGAHRMQALDWFDAIYHGLPWILLIRLSLVTLFQKLNPKLETK
jgi:hypothetical protein